ncbi:unnamed protein product [Parajaminaea phylloscopi]
MASIPPMPGSPALSATSSSLGPTLPPHLRPSTIVTRKDQAESLHAYEGLLTASKAYTQALLSLSSASNDFAFALQDCARLKGAHKVGSQLHAASGLEFLVASHSKLLADEFWKGFSIPLLEAFDAHRQAVAERQMAHERAMAERSRELKECEEKNLRGAAKKRGKERDLGSFRRALEELQRMVNGLDEERAGHYVEVLGAEEEEWDKIATRVSHLLRLQLEVHERLSSKPLSDPVLEPMLSAIPDPFGAWSQPHGSTGAGGCGDQAEMFSVLQHSGLLDGQQSHDAETLTPAGLLSPRTPATGLPRAPGPSSSSSSTRQRDSVSAGTGLDGLGVGPVGGAHGEISFAALGLTSASHPQSSGASGIGSPLFGSEDGSSRGDDDNGGEGADEDPKTPTRRQSDRGPASNNAASRQVVAGGKGLGRRLRKALSIIDDEEKSRRKSGVEADSDEAGLLGGGGATDGLLAGESEPADLSTEQEGSESKHSHGTR